jgi:hypothetical protein
VRRFFLLDLPTQFSFFSFSSLAVLAILARVFLQFAHRRTHVLRKRRWTCTLRGEQLLPGICGEEKIGRSLAKIARIAKAGKKKEDL